MNFKSKSSPSASAGMASPASQQMSAKPRRHLWRIMLWVFGGMIVLIVGLLTALTLLLTPERLSQIAEREASDYFNADVKVSNLRFTLWSTFPRLCLQADSISVISRSLDSISPALRASLPDNADFLGSVGAVKGGVNLMRLLSGRIRLHDVEVRDLNINLVTANDSVANYLILPPDNTTQHNIPEVSANDIRIVGQGHLSYFSASSGLDAKMLLKGMDLKEERTNGYKNSKEHKANMENNYRLRASGQLSLASDTVTLLSGFPFGLNGRMGVRYKPFGLVLSDFGIDLADLHSSMNMNLYAGNSVNVNDFSYNIASFHLMRLLEYLPSAWLPDMEGVTGDMTVNVSARLLSPFNLTSGTLPDFVVNLNVPDGDIGYRARGIPPINLRHVGLSAALMFNGACPDSSYVEIPRFTLSGDGVTLGVEGRVTDLLSGTPHVRGTLDMESDISDVGALWTPLGEIKPHGALSMQADMAFTMPSGSTELTDMSVYVRGRVRSLHLKRGQLTAGADSLVFRLGSRAAMASPEALREGMTDLGMDISGLHLTDGTLRLGVKSLSLSSSGKDSLDIAAGSAKADLLLDGVTLNTAHTTLNLDDLRLICDLHKDSRPMPAPCAPFAESAQPDSRWLKEYAHTPLWINSPLSENTRKYLANHDISLRLLSSGGRMKIEGYGPRFDFGQTDLTICNDSVSIDRFGFRSGGSELRLNGRIPSLRPWLLSATPQPLVCDLTVNVDTLNINSLARALALASGKKKDEHFHASDSLDMTHKGSARTQRTFLIPRNISANIHLRGDEVIYTNLNLTRLHADIRVADGNAEIPDLRLTSSFGGASMGVGYNSSDMEKIGLTLKGALTDIDLTGFFNKFESLPRRWPSLRNLTGTVSADVALGMHVFPDMEIEMASLDGDVNVSARNLVLKQNDFIHHIASMMLIHTHRPIHIANIALHATVHDNLLEVYPFTFEFERYRLIGEGVNNFAGELDYHIGVMHSPVPIHFGIDIKGMFHNPKVRFGRAGWDNRNARKVTGKVEKSFNINLVHDATVLGDKFMHEGAVYPE